ncbi:MAG: efflux RND transporter permease subunit [Paracoccaceae bacterium]
MRKPGGILAYFAAHRTAANLLLVLMVAGGLVAIPQMRAQYFPDVVVENVRVSVGWAGAGAEDVDAAIVQVLEPALMVVEGVERTVSTSFEGRASMVLTFEPGWDMARAADDVEGAIRGASNLPADADDPSVRWGGWRDRVTDVMISGPVGVEQLGRFADEMVTRLFAEGITRTTIRGMAAPSTIIEVPSVALMRHDVSMADIAAAIGREVNASPAGDVGGASARVRAGVAKRSADEIAAIVLRSNPDGSTLTVGDVADIHVEGIDRDVAFFVGDHPAISVMVERSADGDAIKIQRQVEDVAADMLLTLPDRVVVELTNTRAEEITARLTILLQNGAMGLALVVGLLFLFLNARTAFWVAAGIPVAMIAAIGLMYVFGFTFNMISLFALIITLGIVVDDAIVVGEYADLRIRRLGEAPLVAAQNAAIRMWSPVFSATITTVIAFFGLTMIGGNFGAMIADIPFTVIVVLIASLVECFLILPNHLSHASAAGQERWYDMPSRVVNVGFVWVRERLFRPLMAGVVWARYPVAAVALLLLATQSAHLIRGDLPWRFFNSPEQPSVSGNFSMAPGAVRADTMEMMREMQRATEAVATRFQGEYGLNPIAYVSAQVGGNAGRGLVSAESKEPDQLGAISIELIGADLRPYSNAQFVSALQQEVINHPLAEEVSFRGWRSGPGGDALDIQLSGASADGLKSAAEALKTALSQYPEVSALEDSLAYDKEELVLELTPQGQALGFSIDALGRTLRNRLAGIEAATYPEGTRSAAIRVQLPPDEQTADFLESTLMRTAGGVYVPLADIVSVETRSGFSSVRRENGVRLVNITGDLGEDDPARASAIMAEVETAILPRIAEEHGVSFRLSGLSEQESEFLSDAAFGFALCALGIYLTLAWIFSSWGRPLVIMSIMPFGLIGVVYGHMLWDVPLSLFSIVGLIGMAGIITNDSIILVSTVDEYAQDRDMFRAIIDGAADRLRPILLTTLTTVLGLAPLLYEGSSEAQFLKPTVITLVYGLGFGMVLVLLVVPALMAMQVDVMRQFAALRRARGLRTREPVLTRVLALAAVAMAGLFAGIVGPLLWPGAGADTAQIARAFALFAAAAAAVAALAYGAGAHALARAGRRAGP